MFAIIETGGKQYKVAQGDVIYVEKLDCAADDSVTIDRVIMAGEGDSVTMGDPYIKGASVVAKVVKNGKSKKILVFKYKAKKNYRRRQGHRQPYTKLQIESIKA